MPPHKLTQRLVVRSQPARQKTKAQIFSNTLLQLAAGAYVHREPVQPQLQHQPRVVGFLPFFAVGLVKMAQLQPFDHLVDQKAQMPGGQLIAYVTGQQLGLFGRISEIVWHDSSSPILLFPASA